MVEMMVEAGMMKNGDGGGIDRFNRIVWRVPLEEERVCCVL